MSSIDNRVVNMEFNNGAFQKRASSTLDSLARLKGALNLSGAAKGFAEINAASARTDLSPLSRSIDNVSGKFIALSTVAITALSNITNKAVNAGIELGKALTVDAKTAGFDEYELKMGSIQTILANTSRHGTGLDVVNEELERLNEYADQTIYNFADMTKNASLFTNSGMRIEDATQVIKGFSNSAAASGTSAQGAAGAAYQLSQALSAGTVRLMDWRSLTNVGMGGKNMQEGLITLADSMGMFNESTTTAQAATDDFNGSLESQWLSADVMSSYLKIMAGDMTDAEMAALGLSEANVKMLKDQAAMGMEAATKVRTFSHLMDTLKEASASGWTESFELIVGDFEEATELFTGISDSVGGALDGMSDRRNAMLKEWKDGGGRDAVLQGFSNIFTTLGNVIKPVQEAFRDIFPPSSVNLLLVLSKGFESLTEKIKMGADFGETLGEVFRGIFAGVKAIMSVLSSAGSFLIGFLEPLGGIFRGLMSMAAAIGIVAQRFFEWLDGMGLVQDFFDFLSGVRDNVITPLADAFEIVGDAFKSLAMGDTDAFFDKIGEAGKTVEGVFTGIHDSLGNFIGMLGQWASKAASFLGNIGGGAFDGLASTLEWIGDLFGSIFDAFDVSGVDKTVGDAVASISPLEKAGETLKAVWEGIGKFFSGIGDFFEPLTSALGSIADRMSDYISAFDTTDAVALFNAGMIAGILVTIRKVLKNIKTFTTDFSGVWDEIKDTFKGIKESTTGAIDQLTSTLKTMQADVRANIVLKIAAAVGILAVSLKLLSTIPEQDLKPALFAIGGLIAGMGALIAATAKMSFSDDAMLVKTGIYIIGVAIAVGILADAVKDMSGLSWEEMAKGLITVGGILGAIMLFTQFSKADSASISSGAGLMLLAVAVKILGTVIEDMGSMDIKTLAKGLGVITGVIAALTGFAYVTKGGTGIFSAAAAMGVLAIALWGLQFVLDDYAAMDWKVVAEGLGLMAGVIIGLGIAMRALPTKSVIAGSIAIGLLAGAMWLMAEVLEKLSGIQNGLQTVLLLAGALGVLVASVLLLQGAMAGVLLLGVVALGLMALAQALTVLGELDLGDLGIALLAIVGVLVALGLAALILSPVIPMIAALAIAVGLLGAAMLLAGVGFLAFATGFALFASVGTAGIAVMIAAFEGIIALIPLFAEQIGLGIRAFAKVISESGPEIIAALSTILTAILTAIEENIPPAVALIVTLILALAEAIRGLIPTVARLAGEMLLDFLNEMWSFLDDLTQAGMDMLIHIMAGIADKIPDVVDTAADMIWEWLDGIERKIPVIVRKGGRVIRVFIDEMATQIETLTPWIVGRAMDMGGNIINGVRDEILAAGHRIKDALMGILGDAWDNALSFLGIRSPSRKFMWMSSMMIAGAVKGLDREGGKVSDSTKKVANDAVETMKTGLAAISSLGMDIEQPTIRPVLDLSDVEKKAQSLNPLLNKNRVELDGVVRSAGRAEQGIEEAKRDYFNKLTMDYIRQEQALNEPKVVFNQNNNSPKALSTAEIYRQSRNLLSSARREITSNA